VEPGFVVEGDVVSLHPLMVRLECVENIAEHVVEEVMMLRVEPRLESMGLGTLQGPKLAEVAALVVVRSG
jgi:hypothetical protein